LSEVRRIIDLKRAVRVRGEFYPAKQYRVPEELDEGLASWFINKGMAEEVAVEIIEPERKAEEPKPAPKEKIGLERLKELVGNDYIEVFAPAGHGKSRLLAHLALEAIRAGKKVIYLDCEHSLPLRIQRELGKAYQRLDFMNLDGIINAIATLPKGYDLICYDSLGFPVLIKFVQMNLRERGDAIAKTILLRGHLKHYAGRNGALAIAANQPVSELWGISHPEESEEHRPPVGGKSIHIAKAVLRMDIAIRNDKSSVFELRAFECQDMPFNRLRATFTIDEKGERLEWRI